MTEFFCGLIVGLVAGLAWMAYLRKADGKYWADKLSKSEAEAYRKGEQDAWNFAVQSGKNVRRFVEGSLK